MNAIIIGDQSDIAKAIKPMLEKDGYEVSGWHRGTPWSDVYKPWDLVIITVGKVSPVGLWHDAHHAHWAECIYSNLTLPFQFLQKLWPHRRENATVIWFAGSNPQKIMDGYSAYMASKMAVIKLVEQLDHESPDCKFVAFGPGYARTKIHEATLKANWPNERIARGDDGNSMEDIYAQMIWCVHQSKAMVGGRNICVSDGRADIYDYERQPHIYKLRRVEWQDPYPNE